VATDQAVLQFQLLSRWTCTPLIFERTVKSIPHVPRGFASAISHILAMFSNAGEHGQILRH
jgi:hypothetical protein